MDIDSYINSYCNALSESIHGLANYKKYEISDIALNILGGQFEQNPLILLRKSCLKCDNTRDKIVNIKEGTKLKMNNKIFTNEMKIIIGVKVWNIALYLKK